MDVALLSEIADDREVVRAAAGAVDGLGVRPGASAAMRDTVCERVLAGRVAGVIGDLAGERAVRDRASVRDTGARSYLGVPLTTEDARLYMLCCLSREVRPDLGPEDLAFLHGVAEAVKAALDEDDASDPYAYLRDLHD